MSWGFPGRKIPAYSRLFECICWNLYNLYLENLHIFPRMKYETSLNRTDFHLSFCSSEGLLGPVPVVWALFPATGHLSSIECSLHRSPLAQTSLWQGVFLLLTCDESQVASCCSQARMHKHVPAGKHGIHSKFSGTSIFNMLVLLNGFKKSIDRCLVNKPLALQWSLIS